MPSEGVKDPHFDFELAPRACSVAPEFGVPLLSGMVYSPILPGINPASASVGAPVGVPKEVVEMVTEMAPESSSNPAAEELWARSTKIPDVNIGPLVVQFAGLLAPLSSALLISLACFTVFIFLTHSLTHLF